MTQLLVIAGYLALVLGLGLLSRAWLRRTSADYMLASHTIGPFLLLMSLFGTTMTGFALVGSTGESFELGVGVYALLASSSGIVHSLCFFFVGVKLWTFGRRHGYRTQIQFFRDRLESDAIGWLLFPVLVGMVVVYLLIGVIPSGAVIEGVTRGVGAQPGAFPELFPETNGGVPRWLGSLVVCLVVLTYVFFGGMRGTAWANAFQTLVFMALGVVTYSTISAAIGGPEAASQRVQEHFPAKLTHSVIHQPEFFTYLLIPLSVGMFPHVFQHWLTARTAATFKLPIVAHPIFILIVWLPCVLLGVWATSVTGPEGQLLFPPDYNANTVLGAMVGRFANPLLAGLLSAGILAAIMSSLDSQFLCLGTMFTEDVVLHGGRRERFDERTTVTTARLFVVAVVATTYGLSLLEMPRLFRLGIWCFSGFAALFPLAVAACYWRRLTAAGAFASVIATLLSGGLLLWDSGFAENPEYTFLGMLPVATMVASSTVALIAVSLVSKPPSDATLAKFFRKRI